MTMTAQQLAGYFPGASQDQIAGYMASSPTGGGLLNSVFGSSGSQGPESLTGAGAMTVDQLRSSDLSKLGSVGGGGVGGGSGLGLNVGTGQLALSGLNSLASAWTAYQASNLAKKQFDFTSRMAETNMRNSIQSFNTQLGDRATSRAAVNGQSDADRDAYIAANRLRG